MPKRLLDAAFVRSAKPLKKKKAPRKGEPIVTEYLDEKERGLALRISPAGVRSWTFRYRNQAKRQRRISLGKLDDVSLADARALVVTHRAIVAKGGDPAEFAAREQQAAIDAFNRETVAEVGELYFRECAAGRHRPNAKRAKRQSTIDLERYYFDRRILPALGHLKLADLTRSLVQTFVNDLADKHSPSTARQGRIILHAIFTFAMRHEIVSSNPVQMVSIAAMDARMTTVKDADLKKIWNALTPPIEIEDAAISAGVAYSIRLAMVTLQRRGEVTGMRLDEIDLANRIWIIPQDRTKNHRTHVVPLSNLAVELIEQALRIRCSDSPYVFPSPRDSKKPIRPEAMTRAFGRMKRALKLGDIRPHDLRRTGATNLTSERLGFPRFTVSKILNHASDTGNSAAVTSVYDRNEYLAEKRRALDAWAKRIVQITSETEPTDNVVQLRT